MEIISVQTISHLEQKDNSMFVDIKPIVCASCIDE